MTNRPTDDFDDLAEEQVDLNNPAEDDAAFGDGARDGRDDAEPDAESTVDDNDFVEDDMADIADELSDEELSETDDFAADGEESLEDEEAYGEEGVEYDIVEGQDEPAGKKGRAGKADDGKRYFGKYKKNDLIFYGILGVGGLIALIVLITSTMSDEPVVQEQPIAVDSSASPAAPQGQQAQITGMVVPNNNDIPTARDLPATAPEPSPDGIGVPGAISTLKNEPAEAAATPPAVMPEAPQQPMPEMPPVAEQAQQAAPSAQQQPQAQAPQQPVPEEPLAPVAQVTAPPTLGVDNTALSDRMSEMGVKLAELNAQLSQINDSISTLQKTTDTLGKQSQELAVKTADLGGRIDQQTQRVDQKFEEANKQREALAKQTKEAGANNNATVLDDLKISVAQLERRVSAMGKGQTQQQTQPVRQPQSFDGPPPPTATPVKKDKKPAADAVEIPAPPAARQAERPPVQPQMDAQPTVREIPRSPKSRDQAGMLYEGQKNSWVLRAATPNMAWLSPRAGSAELRRVAPGDTVDGIGQIQEIRQEAGRWVVIGTQGSVR